ncbi:MAG: hypothetical protein WCI51_16045 [Lentisphaerota bacterium]
MTFNPTEKVVFKEYPFTVGVPFKQGELKDISKLKLVDNSGSEIPFQMQQLNAWPQDKSVQWVMIDFIYDLNGKHEEKLKLEVNTASARKEAGDGIIIKETAKDFEVNTGGAVFNINKERFNLFDSVRIGQKSVLAKEAKNLNIYFKNKDGNIFASCLGAPDEVKVELNGAIRSVIKAEGWFYSEKGEKSCRYIARLNFFKGKAFVKMHYTFLVTENSDKAKFSDIGITIPVKAEEVSWGGRRTIGGLKEGVSEYLLQYDNDKFLLGTGNKPENWKAEGDGRRAAGWAGLFGKDFSAMIFISNFWQEFPNELEVVGHGALTYHLWPAHGVAMPDRKVTDANRQYLWFCHEGKILDFKVPETYYASTSKDKQEEYKLRYIRNSKDENCMGVAKSAEIFIDFNIQEKDCAKMALLLENTPLIMPSPERMCSSGVFGRILPVSPEKYSEAEKALSKLFDCERRLQDYTKDYGKFNYGDSHTVWNDKIKRWDDAYRCWRGYHHCSGTVPWMLYIRSGDPKYFRWAVANARHLMDIDMCNWTTPEYEKLEYPHGKIKGGLNDYKGLSHWHSGNRLMDYNNMTNFMIYYYYLTGDRRGLDVAEMWGNSVKEKFKTPNDGRAGAGTSSALLDLYLATGDKKYFEIADTYVKHMFNSQNMNSDRTFCNQTLSYINGRGKIIPKGAFSGDRGWENYAPWLEKYYDITGDKQSAERIVLWADAYIEGYGDTASIWGLGGDCINLMAYAYFITKDTKYLEYGMFYLIYYLNGIVNKQGDLMDGFGTIGQTSLGFGYMSLRIPIFLAALNDYGKPVKPRFIEKGLPSILSRPPEIFILNKDGKSFTINIGVCSEKGSIPVQVKIINPRGKELLANEIKGEAYIHYSMTIPASEAGVYKAIFTDPKIQLFDFSISDGLQWVWLWNTNIGGRAGGSKIYFKVPEKTTELTISLAPSFMNTGSSFLELLRPDGKSEAQFCSGTYKISVSIEDAGKVWGLRGIFGKNNNLSIMADGKKIAPYVATDSCLYFNPNDFFIPQHITHVPPVKFDPTAYNSALSSNSNKGDEKMNKTVKTVASAVAGVALAVSANGEAGINIDQQDGKLNKITINTGSGSMEISRRERNNTVFITAGGQGSAAADPLLYSLRSKDMPAFLTSDALWPAVSAETTNDGKTLILASRPPDSGLEKKAAVTFKNGDNVIFVENRTSAEKQIKLAADMQTLQAPQKNLELYVDGNNTELKPGEIKDCKWVMYYNTCGNFSYGIIFCPGSDQWNKLIIGDASKPVPAVQFGKTPGTKQPGYSATQRYILVWGDGNLLEKMSGLAKQAAAGELDKEFYPLTENK